MNPVQETGNSIKTGGLGTNMTPDEYRRLALSLPGVVESTHMGHPDFRVGGKIIATIWNGDGVLMLKPEQQARLVRSAPGTFSPAKGGWGKRGSTNIRLDAADARSVRAALMTAWRNKAPPGFQGNAYLSK